MLIEENRFIPPPTTLESHSLCHIQRWQMLHSNFLGLCLHVWTMSSSVWNMMPFLSSMMTSFFSGTGVSWVEVPELCSPRVKRWLGADVSKSHAPTPGWLMCQRLMLLLRLIKVKLWPKNPLHLSPSPNKTRPKNAGMRILTCDDHAYFSDLCMPFQMYISKLT